MTTRALGSSVRIFPAELCLNINQASIFGEDRLIEQSHI
jgi:hypothetical protein